MWRSLTAVALALAAVPAPAWGPPAQESPGEVVVSAAASLTDALAAAARLYESRTGEHVTLNFAGSNVLARQIRAGARVDLFIPADLVQMMAVAADTVPGTRVALLANTLVVVVPSDRTIRFASARDLLRARIRRVAIGEPSSVPAGVYAREYLRKAGVWDALQPRLVPMGSVRLALAAVESGAADAAIVFSSDVSAANRAAVALEVPQAEGPSIVYPAAVMRTGRNPEGARRFLTFLQGGAARDLFTRAGFLVP